MRTIISKSAFVPVTSPAFFTNCKSPQVLVNVPDFSYAFAAGNTTSAITAVSVRNMSCTTTKLFEKANGSIFNRPTGFEPTT